MNWLKRLLIGKPLRNEALHDEKYSVFWGLPILASDAMSSVAYASDEILLVLIPAIGILAYHQMMFAALGIILLLAMLTVSYRQTIEAYPCGGGSYIVASDNLGTYAGVAAGSALLLDYILTVSVSISSGVLQLVSAFPFLLHYQVPICLALLGLLYIGNLRGIRESSRIFGLPAYAFMIAIISMVVVGFAKIWFFGYVPPAMPPTFPQGPFEALTLVLMLKAFASGCTALTGVEAVSNAVPNFKDPAPKRARTVLMMLSLVVFALFGGISLLANSYHVYPTAESSLLVQVSSMVFGHNFMHYFVTFTALLILVMAANTAYADFPMLLSLMGRDGYAPRQLSRRGERLNYANGISMLTVVAAVLIAAFKGDTHALLSLYAIGVFISFTLSQSGMFARWLRLRGKGWVRKAIVNGMGALVSFIVVLMIGITKFPHGAWIIIVLIPILMAIMLRIKRHYIAVAEQLRMQPEELENIDLSKDTYRNHVIVPVESINKTSVRALRYAKTISNNVVAFNVSIDEESAKRIKEKWQKLKTDIPLIVKYSPYRKVISPLLEFIESYEEHSYKKGDMITVILPQFSVSTWWHIFLHNQSRFWIARDLLKHKHIVVATMPLQLKRDDEVLTKADKIFSKAYASRHEAEEQKYPVNTSINKK